VLLLYIEYPLAAGKQIVINVVGKYDLPKEATDFYDNATTVLKDLNTIIRFSILQDRAT
jgi:hypothetical protein